jgi:hypothetical protein
VSQGFLLDVHPPWDLIHGFWGICKGWSHSAPPWTSTNPWEGHLRAPLDAGPPLGSGGFDSWVLGDLQGLVLCFVTLHWVLGVLPGDLD